MSTDAPVRPPEAAAEEPKKKRGLTLTPQRSGSSVPLAVGGPPRANLLPPEIILKRKQLKMRRSLRVGVLFVGIAVAAGCVGSFGYAAAAQVQLGIAQSTQASLVAEQARYADVRAVKETIATIEAGQLVGASTEIDWHKYLVNLQASLPTGVQLTSVSIDEATPMTAFVQSEGPLQEQRVASISFTTVSASLPEVSTWLRSLAKLDGFVDATAGSVTFGEGAYTAEVLMHINADAFSHRFDPSKQADESKAEGQ